MWTILRLVVFSSWLLVPLYSFAQQKNSFATSCSIQELTTAQRETIEQQALLALRVKMVTNATFSAITYVPIRPHILRMGNGTGGMSLSSINQVIAITNRYYLQNGFGIQFYFAGTTPDYVDNDNTYACYDSSKESLITQGHDVTNALNQYYVNQFCDPNQGGYAYYPANDVSSTRSFILNNADNLDDMGSRMVPHELGHNFNLLHTYGSGATTTELVTRGAGANCTTDGDLVCDTPADPYNKPGVNLLYDANGCPSYDPASTARDANNQAYSPSLTNIMSYYFPCTHNFTSGQYDRMQAGLALRQSHTAYSLTYPPTIVATPSNLIATLSDNTIILTWQDNANNEMGYFIERSLSPTSGFLPIGGVGPNEITFTDLNAAPLKTYYYRIRPSNATTSAISQVISIQTPACHPSFAYACEYPVGLSNVAVNNVVLSQNSGCSSNGYGVFLTSTTVLAGMSYPISGTFLYGSYSQGVAIWVDLNRDGVFDTNQGEQLFQTPTAVTGQFSGTLTLPDSLTAGGLPIRVVTIYGDVPTEPCGTYYYGETEDYVLTIRSVVAPADLSLTLRTNVRVSALNQPVSYSLTIHNDGPFRATGVQWQNRLPQGLTFVSGDPTVTASATAISSTTALSLAVGQSMTYTYQLQPTIPGTFINAAQIMTSDQPDPDSQPGSGTGDGQDDQASTDIRTIITDGSVYSSPNPNQTPLPTVISNQPTPNPTKADLSLSMSIDNRTPKVGYPVTLTIIISNLGGASASNIVVRDTLRGLTFSSSTTGMGIVASFSNYTIVEGTVASLSAGSSTALVFKAIPTAIGNVINRAQIWSCTTPDPDSSPGSVTPTGNNFNGEDDTASIDLRALTP